MESGAKFKFRPFVYVLKYKFKCVNLFALLSKLIQRFETFIVLYIYLDLLLLLWIIST